MQPKEGEGAGAVLRCAAWPYTVALLPNPAPALNSRTPIHTDVHATGMFWVHIYTHTHTHLFMHTYMFWDCIKGILCVFTEAL